MSEPITNKLQSKRISFNKLIFFTAFLSSGFYHVIKPHFFDGQIQSIKITFLDNYFLGAIAFAYIISGFITIIGLLLPNKWGAKITMVGSEEDLAHYRPILWGSSICIMAIGIGLFILLFSGSDGYFSPIIGLSAVTIAYILSFIITYRQWPYYDEILRKAVFDASYICLIIIFTILWFWCAAAWTGWVSAPSPLGLLALVNITYIISLSWTYNRLGLFKMG